MTLLKNTFLVATVLAAQGANAWIFTWRDNTSSTSVEFGQQTEGCKAIEHAGGKVFNWDPKDSGLCILMYADDLCKEGIAGKSCGAWDKSASRDISAFRVVTEEVANGAEAPGEGDDATATGTNTGSATGTATETGEPTATGTESGSNTAEPTETGEPTGKPTKTGSASESGSESGTGPAPTGTATHPASHSGSQPTDAPSSSAATDAPASTQTGAAAATGAPAAGIFGALAAAAAFAI